MALKKPLVLNLSTGKPELLQSGDTLDATTTNPRERTLTNSNAGAIVIGRAVYIDGNDSCDLAQANASGTAGVFGLVKTSSIASATPGSVISNGPLEATTTQWDAVTGGTGGLTAGAEYFLSASEAGALVTDVSGYSAGSFVVRVGRAVSTTVMEVEPRFVAKL